MYFTGLENILLACPKDQRIYVSRFLLLDKANTMGFVFSKMPSDCLTDILLLLYSYDNDAFSLFWSVMAK